MPRLMLAALLAVVWSAGSAMAGAWTFEIESPQGSVTRSMDLEQDGSSVSGTTTAGGGTTVDVSGTVDGNEVELTYSLDAAAVGALTITVTGTVDGSTMSGTLDYGGMASGSFTASKD